MGCFSLFPCFTSSKHHRHHPKHYKSVNPTTPTSSSSSFAHQGYHNNNNCQTVLTKVPTQESTNIQSLHTPIPKSRDNNNNNQAQLINDSDNNISVIDLHVDNHKDVSTEDFEDLSVETEAKKENGKLGAFMQIKDEIKKEKQDNKRVQVEIDNDNKIDMEVENESDKENEVKTDVPSRAISDSSVSSYISYPPMHSHRYGNLVTNEDADQLVIQQESSESLFSLSINPRRLSKSCPVEADDKEVNSPLKTSSPPKMTAKTVSSCTNEDGNCLLNPIENLAQWKTLKSIPSLDHNQEKENLYLEQEDIPIPVSEDPSFKVLDMKGKVKNNNTALTTSLSSWLVDPEKSMTESKQEESQFSTGNSYAYSDEATSWKSFEDRPILGAWTIDEVKQVSARSSPRKSPRRSPDDTPIIGTVGSYWSHTKQATDYSSSACTSPLGRSANSKRNKVNKAVSCHSSPTKRRLDRAFNKTGV
ncbi:hypothetical protein M8C21_005661 [Ambrosia artemisiifolia]|uniref:Uncharacterized protein n=1 Tax=Ambrosia artemisiifolia TaxID=4212 RepID=A0AAD5CLQ6_AMBAR|nr:hypothetical protein M8C21_005661 [Ambrosia artemisiifolia]